MGPEEAAYAVAKFLTSVKHVVPMHFGTFPLLKGTVEEFKHFFGKWGPEYKRADIHIHDQHTILKEAGALPK
jgi:L-ascorbate metabolism protein UlaG (beta-lactamase superfamily)